MGGVKNAIWSSGKSYKRTIFICHKTFCARGNNTERSDVDIAVYGGDFDSFYWDIKENIHSLLMFDVINADDSISEELKKEIKKDGVVIYEKAW